MITVAGYCRISFSRTPRATSYRLRRTIRAVFRALRHRDTCIFFGARAFAKRLLRRNIAVF